MSTACVVFDFDGTLTDPGPVVSALQDATRKELACRLGLTEEQVNVRWQEAVTRLASLPISEGWEHEGHVVASIRADPYVWTNALTRHVLGESTNGALSPVEMDRMVVSVHQAAHGVTPAPFRRDAKRVLDTLVSAGKHVFVVSNSIGDTVGRRLDELGLRGRDRVHVSGGAGKFVIRDPAFRAELFERLPATMRLEGLERPVLLRRGKYFEKLEALWARCGASPETTLVCGDIFEIDLAMPAALGCATHLLVRADALPYERDAVVSMPGGSASDELEPVLDRC